MRAMPANAEHRAEPASSQDSAILQVEALSITFPGLAEGDPLVDGVDLAIPAGCTLGLVGESGCGKSLVSLAVMGLLTGTPARIVGGRARFEGRDLLDMDAGARGDLRGGRMAMIFQEPMTSLNPAFTIGDQIAETIIRHQGLTGSEARRGVLDLLRRVQIPAAEKRLGAYPHQLSGGMRQRVMIAMALANRPRLLIADEPTTALDVTIQAQILRLMQDLQREAGMAVLLVTHDLGVIAEIADEVAVMYAGRIVERGPVGAVFDDPQHPYTIGLMGSLPSIGERRGRLAAIPGTVPAPGHWPRGCRFASRCPFADARCRNEKPPTRDMKPGHVAACFKAPIEALQGSVA